MSPFATASVSRATQTPKKDDRIRSILKRLPGHHTTAVAYLALFAALGGSAYAAATVTGSNIKDGTVTGKDIRNGTIAGGDIKGNSLSGAQIKRAGSVRFPPLPAPARRRVPRTPRTPRPPRARKVPKTRTTSVDAQPATMRGTGPRLPT